MWSERHSLNRQQLPLIVGFFLMFTVVAGLFWHLQLRHLQRRNLEESARLFVAPVFKEARQELGRLGVSQFDRDHLHVNLKRLGTRLFPALLASIEPLEGVRLVDARGRILFSRGAGTGTAAAGVEQPLTPNVSSLRRSGRIEVTVPLMWHQQVVAGVVCVYNQSAGAVKSWPSWYTGLGLLFLLGLLGTGGALVASFGLTRALRQLAQRSEALGTDQTLAATTTSQPRGELQRLSASLDRLERALTASESKYHTLLEAAHDGIAVVAAADKTLTYTNPRLAELIGFETQHMVRRSIFDFLFPEEHDTYRAIADMLIQDPRRAFIGEVRLKHRSGNEVLVEVSITPLFIDQVLFGLVICRDLSRRRETELRLKTLDTAIEHADEEILITDRDALIQYVNPAFERNSGYSKAEVLGKNPRMLQGGEVGKAFYQEMWRTLLAGKVWRGRFINRCKDGRRCLLDANISPITDDNGTISGFVAVRRDVGEKVQMERQLVQSQKMEAIGTLAGGIAHDFNNILAAILGYSELALLDLSPHSELYKNLTQIYSAGERARELIQQILTYSRQSKTRPRFLDVRAIMTEILELLRASLPANIGIQPHLVEKAFAFSDATQIHQIVMNLCTNAAHAMSPQGGDMSVTLERICVDGEHELVQQGMRPGAFLHIEVADTGQGIPAVIQKRVFDPYFTTKARGKGTGMGLAVVHSIVRQLGGRILLQSEVGVGSRFSVYLPAVDTEAAVEEGRGAVRYQGRGVVFFVDDESPLVEIGCRMMTHLGFEPQGFACSPAALKAFEADPGAVDLVVTDMTMPEMTGDVLAGRMLALRPDLPIILCSGYSEHIDEALAVDLGIGAFLNKPFGLRALAAAVASLVPQTALEEAQN
jgi:PAS domain S-box-containing protein